MKSVECDACGKYGTPYEMFASVGIVTDDGGAIMVPKCSSCMRGAFEVSDPSAWADPGSNEEPQPDECDLRDLAHRIPEDVLYDWAMDRMGCSECHGDRDLACLCAGCVDLIRLDAALHAWEHGLAVWGVDPQDETNMRLVLDG